MRNSILVLTIFACWLTQSCNSQSNNNSKDTIQEKNKQIPPGAPRITKQYDSSKIENFYPFIIYKDGSFMIAAEIESKDLLDKYSPVFEKYSYSGNGYSWEGHIKQILKKEEPNLLSHIQFDPEAGGFYAFADSEKSQRRFVEILSPIFKDIPKLEAYLKSADRSKIDD